MNSYKRFLTAFERDTPDELPVAPMVNVPHASRVLGVKPWEYVTDNELYVKGSVTTTQSLRHLSDDFFINIKLLCDSIEFFSSG